jgi:hypothetical protein
MHSLPTPRVTAFTRESVGQGALNRRLVGHAVEGMGQGGSRHIVHASKRVPRHHPPQAPHGWPPAQGAAPS